jgi:microcystin-dependent protein
MSDPFVGQIISIGFNWAPVGWFLCDGSLKPINQYQVLFQLVGTTYGGDGLNTFGVPDLRGRVPLSMGQGLGLSTYVLGAQVGAETVTLTPNQTALHNHTIAFSANAATATAPTSGIAVGSSTQTLIKGIYAPGPATVGLNLGTIRPNHGGLPHENRQPYQVLNYIIAYNGIYPSQG